MRNAMKIFYALLLSFTVIASTISEVLPAQASDPVVTTDFKANNFGLWSQSSIYGQNYMGSTKLEDWKQLWCKSWEDPSCSDYDQLYSDLILRPCLTDSDRACLDGIEATNSKNVLEKLKFYGESTSQKIPAYKFKTGFGSEMVDIPAGGGLSVWKSSELNPDGTEKFYAGHVLLRYLSTCNRTNPKIPCSINLSDFKGSVYPVSVKSGTSCREFALEDKCVDSLNFKGSERISLTLRMDKQLTGWIFGRMQNADFSVTPLDATYNKIRIEGDVTLVPELTASIPKSEIAKDPKLEKYLRDFFTVGTVYAGVPNPGAGSWNDESIGGLWSKTYPDFLAAQTTTRLLSPNFNGFELFSAFESHLKPYSPKAENNGRNILRETNSIFWNFGANAYTGNNKCSADKSKLHGMVVTNAPIFDNGPPEFKNGVLNYKVAGIHANLDGSLFQGRYTYIVRSDTARCYYGFSDAPIVATVEVVSADNSTQLATVSVLENKSTGFIKLQAENFTFSSPTIKVKLVQDKPLETVKAEPAKAETAKAPSAAVAKKVITITCAKGKITKKYSGANPKCPSGYKKK
jgi:hypothetical protein